MRMSHSMEKLVDSGMIGVFFWDPKGFVREANDAFLEIVGYTRADLEEGRLHWFQLTPPEYADAWRRRGSVGSGSSAVRLEERGRPRSRGAQVAPPSVLL